MKKNEIDGADGLLLKYGQKAIDEVIETAKQMIEIQNDVSFELYSKDFDENYMWASPDGEHRIISKRNPLSERWDEYYAHKEFDCLLTYEKYVITSIIEKNGKLEFVSQKENAPVLTEWIRRKRENRSIAGIKCRPDLPNGEITFSDGRNYWNTWNGWATKPDASKSCKLFLDFLLEVVCNNKVETFEFVMDFVAQIIQHPTVKHPKVLALRGEQGAGKNTFTDALEYLLGADYATSISSEGLVGKFNSQLFGKILIIADEAMWAGSHSGWSPLKRLTGQKTIQIECKGKDIFTADNYLHVIIVSNDGFVSPIEEGNRRIVPTTVSSAHIGDTNYFKTLREELENGGYEALMSVFQTREIKTDFFGAVEIYDVDAVEECRLESMSSENLPAKWLYDCFLGNAPKESNLFFAAYSKDKVDSEAAYDFDGKLISARVLFNRYKLWVDSSGEKKQINSIQFGKHLSKLILNKIRKTSGMYYQIDKAEIKPTLEKVLGFKIKEIEEDDSGQDE